VVSHAPRGAGSERCNGAVRKMLAQAAQLAVFRAKLVTPLRNAVRFVDGEERNGDALQPVERVRARQTLRRKVQQAIFTRSRFLNHLGLQNCAESTVKQGR